MNTAGYSKIWNKGAEYCRSNKVSIEQDRELEAIRVLQGKVNCSFGYVHKPVVAVSEVNHAVTAAMCDCYESSEAEPFCAHCAAVVRQVYHDWIRRVEYDQTIDLKKLTNTRNTDHDAVTLLQITDDGFSRKAEGIARCNFGFVHRPRVTVEDGKVVEFFCDCYLAAESNQMCPHCRSLYAQMSAGNPDAVNENETSDDNLPDGQEESLSGLFEDDGIDSEPEFLSEFVSDEDTPVIPEAGEEPSDPEPAPAEAADPTGPESEFFRDFGGCDSRKEEEETAEASEKTDEAVQAPEESVYAAVPEVMDEPMPDLAEPAEEKPELVLHEPETMEILFGTAKDTGEQVCWYPNDTTRLFHTNTGIIGTMGTGKTQFTKAMIAQLYWEQKHNYTGTPLGILLFDYKGDYNESKPEFVEAVSARVIKPYKLPFNPFSLKGMKNKPQLPLQVASTFATIIEKIYHLGPKQVTILRHCIIEAYQKRGIISANPVTWNRPAPTFDDVYDIYCADEEIKKNDSLFSAMDLLHSYEIFENDVSKTTSLYEMINGVVSVDLSGYDSEIQHLVVAIMLELFYSQMQNAGSSQMSGNYRQLTKLLLVDEADNFMSQGFSVLKKIMKEGREFGVGTILSTQSLEHFSSTDDNYASLILTWVVHQVPDLKRADLEFLFNLDKNSTAVEKLLQQIRSLEKHQSVAKIGTKEPVYIQDKPFWKLLEER